MLTAKNRRLEQIRMDNNLPVVATVGMFKHKPTALKTIHIKAREGLEIDINFSEAEVHFEATREPSPIAIDVPIKHKSCCIIM